MEMIPISAPVGFNTSLLDSHLTLPIASLWQYSVQRAAFACEPGSTLLSPPYPHLLSMGNPRVVSHWQIDGIIGIIGETKRCQLSITCGHPTQR